MLRELLIKITRRHPWKRPPITFHGLHNSVSHLRRALLHKLCLTRGNFEIVPRTPRALIDWNRSVALLPLLPLPARSARL